MYVSKEVLKALKSIVSHLASHSLEPEQQNNLNILTSFLEGSGRIEVQKKSYKKMLDKRLH